MALERSFHFRILRRKSVYACVSLFMVNCASAELPKDPLASPIVTQAVTIICAEGSPAASCMAENCPQVVAKSIVECFDEIPYPQHGTKAQIDDAFSKLAKCGGRHALSHMLEQNALNEHTRQRCESLLALGNTQSERAREDVLANLERNAPILVCRENTVANACFSGDAGKCQAGLAVPATQCRSSLESKLPTTVSGGIDGQLLRPFAACLLKTYRPATSAQPCRVAVDQSLIKLDRNSKRTRQPKVVETSPSQAQAL